MKPEEIVGLIGNIGNRPDIRQVQERQIKEIHLYVASVLEDLAKVIKNTPVPHSPPLLPPIQDGAPIDFMRENQLNAMEKEVGGEMSEEELAEHFKEPVPVRPKEKSFSEMSLEEIKAWESRQDNSNDIYKLSARIKNLARSGGANLTPAGDVLCNSYTHVMKAFYEFADKLGSGSERIRLYDLIRSHENMPGNVISALNAGVR